MAEAKDKGYVALSVRIDKEDNRRFSALLALNETSAAEFLRVTIKDYIKRYEHLLAKTSGEDKPRKNARTNTPQEDRP
ncbi:MAG: hypothetical protein LBI74_04755 [Synergistaceae bacterium]|nr:hypothetical protein [Synergistaceae bacterium]